MTIAGPPTVFGMRNWTYIWPTMIWPGGVGPAGPAPRWADVIGCPPTKKLPSSCSSSGPPSDPAVAVELVPSRSIADSESLPAAPDSRSMIVMAASLIVSVRRAPGGGH
jgi:hypothetical protein